MPRTRAQSQVIASIGGLTRAAMAPDTRALTKAARDARWAKYLNQVPASITDPAERQRRATMLRTADMRRLALRSATVRRRAAAIRLLAEAREAELALLDATGLDQADEL